MWRFNKTFDHGVSYLRSIQTMGVSIYLPPLKSLPKTNSVFQKVPNSIFYSWGGSSMITHLFDGFELKLEVLSTYEAIVPKEFRDVHTKGSFQASIFRQEKRCEREND